MSEIDKLLNKNVGEEVELQPDLIMINDAAGAEEVTADKKVSSEVQQRLVVGFDHDVPTGTPASSAVYQKLAHFADTNDLELVHAKGILYLDILNKLAEPQLIVSTGNHNGIFGSKGSLGLKVTDTELADLLNGQTITRKVPAIFTVELTGNKASGLASSDIAINIWNKLQDQDIKDKLIEFIDGNGSLSQEDKQVISAMSTLFGAMTSVFTENGEADLTIDMAEMDEVVILPEAEDRPQAKIKVQTVDKLADIQFKVGFIGGFTGGNITDLREAAKLVDGKHIKFGKRLNISPATSAVYIQALNEGLVTKFIDFGAQMVATGDKSVVKQGAGIVGKDEVVMSTGSYNYAGCLSDKSAKIYLGSVKSVINAML